MMTLRATGSASVSGSSRSGSRAKLPEEILMEKVEIQRLKDEQGASERRLDVGQEKEVLGETDTKDRIVSIQTKALHEQEKVDEEDNDATNSTKSVKDEGSLEMSACHQPNRSILKRCEGESPTQFVDATGPWFRLNPPDLAEIENTSTSRTSADTSAGESTRLSQPEEVRFSSVQVRLYGQTLGDNPAVTNGAPIQLDWCYNEHPPIDINLFHAGRTTRPIRQLVLSRYYRHKILIHWYNFSEFEIKNANQEAKTIRKQRQQTSMMPDGQFMEECMYSMSRIWKGMFRRRK